MHWGRYAYATLVDIFGSRGLARGTSSLAVKYVLLAIAVRGLRFRRVEAASEWRYSGDMSDQSCVAPAGSGVLFRPHVVSSHFVLAPLGLQLIAG